MCFSTNTETGPAPPNATAAIQTHFKASRYTLITFSLLFQGRELIKAPCAAWHALPFEKISRTFESLILEALKEELKIRTGTVKPHAKPKLRRNEYILVAVATSSSASAARMEGSTVGKSIARPIESTDWYNTQTAVGVVAVSV